MRRLHCGPDGRQNVVGPVLDERQFSGIKYKAHVRIIEVEPLTVTRMRPHYFADQIIDDVSQK